MAVIRWEPVRELHSLQQEMNRLFGSFLDPPGAGSSAAGRQWIPAMDLVERDEHFVLRADLPGVREQDVAIEVEDAVLTVSGERRIEREDAGEGYHRIERATGAFRRSLTLPDGVDPKGIAARFAHGVLEVTIPKPKQRHPERVQIHVGDDTSAEVAAGAGAAAATGQQIGSAAA
jgi:HSP20 family protein